MFVLLISLVIGLFAAMVFLNVYIRVRVLKVYKILVQNEVQFDAKHIFNKEKMQTDIIPKYPKQKENIELFVSHLQYSIRMATVLIVLITLFGAILMYYR